MSRKKLFFENIFAYGFIGVLNKIVPFLLLPLVTRMLPNASDFGVYSMYTTVIGFGTPLAILGLYDAMFREFFEKDDQKYKYDVTTTTQRIIMLSSIIVSLSIIFLRFPLSKLFFGTSDYYAVFILAGVGVFFASNKKPIAAPTRMQNQRKVYVFSGLISSVSLYAIAITLIYLGFAYFGLIYASIVSSIFILLFFWFRNHKFFLKGRFDKEIAKKLFKIGLPLLPTFLIYWIYNSMDKIMIANLLNATELGIYSIGSKVGQISILMYTAFAGGYSHFKYSTMKDRDQISMNSMLFDYLFLLSTLTFLVITPFMPVVFNFLFEGEYVLGYVVAPYLFLSPLIQMSFQVIATQFIVIRKSYITSISLFLGAIINIILNYILIKSIGIQGAAIATIIGYLVSLIIVLWLAVKYNQVILKKRVFITGLVLITYLSIIVFIPQKLLVGIIISFCLSLILLFLYKEEIKLVLISVIKRKKPTK